MKKVHLLQLELTALLQRYQDQLYRSEDSSSQDGEDAAATGVWAPYADSRQLEQLLDSLHYQHLSSTVSMKRLYESEETFRNITRLLQMITQVWASPPLRRRLNDAAKHEHIQEQHRRPSQYAERFLTALLDLRRDRASQVIGAFSNQHPDKAAATSSSPHGDDSGSIIDWISTLFAFPATGAPPESGGEGLSSDNGMKLLAHHHAEFGANHELFTTVLAAMHHEWFYQPIPFEWNNVGLPTQLEKDESAETQSMLSERANRMAAWLDLMQKSGHTPSNVSVAQVVRAHAEVGNLQSARAAERLVEDLKKTLRLDHYVEQLMWCYHNAARHETSVFARTKAAKRLEQYVRMHHTTPTMDMLRIATESMMYCGIAGLPDRVVRVESMLRRLFGRKHFISVVQGKCADGSAPDPPQEGHMMVWHRFLIILALDGKRSELEKAKRILQYMEAHSENKVGQTEPLPKKEHTSRKSLRKRKAYNPEGVPYPSLDTYGAIVFGLKNSKPKARFRGRESGAGNGVNDDDEASDDDNVPPAKLSPNERKSDARYALGLLSSMDEQGLLPTSDLLRQLLGILTLTRTKETGELAEEVLARMELRKLTWDRTFELDHNTYLNVLACWKASSSRRCQGAPSRAFQVLRTMQVHSGLDVVPTDSELRLMSKEEQAAFHAVYERGLVPQLPAYHLVLTTCYHARLQPHSRDRNKAMDVAKEVYEGMLRNGVEPTPKTYAILLSCCERLTPINSERRIELTESFMKDALDREMATPAVWTYLQSIDQGLDDKFANLSDGPPPRPLTQSEEG